MSDLTDILRICQTQDRFAAIESLARNTDLVAAAKSFVELMRHFYWKQKDLPAAIAFGSAGAHFGMFQAARVETTDAALAAQLRGIAKGLTYDLASFTWRGWDEPGIAIAPPDLAVGLDAARANLRFAHELKKGDLPLSRAYWMLAGHQICARDLEAARANYGQAAHHAAAASAKADELLSVGFARLVDLLGSGQVGADAQLESIEDQLRPLENGPGFVQQIETARRVFTGTARG